MAPIYGTPNYDFLDENDSYEEVLEETKDKGLTEITVWYLVVLVSLMLIWLLVFCCLRMLTIRQKTRSQQQRRAYTGSRTRTSLSQSEPTIYVSPTHLPPPPKYEAMAPPSYDEVVGTHYPQYQFPVQPITQPITTALGQGSNSTIENTTVPNIAIVANTAIVANSANVANANVANANVPNANETSPTRSEPDNVQSTVITVTTEESRTSVTVASS